jgi:hypothetical protein
MDFWCKNKEAWKEISDQSLQKRREIFKLEYYLKKGFL